MYTKQTTIGNKLLQEYVEATLEIATSSTHTRGFLRERDEEIIDSHLFNLTQAELVIEPLNNYLENKITLGRLLGFLNAEAECIESMSLTIKEKKQRYVIIIVNALASTLWRHPVQQTCFINRCRRLMDIDLVTWDTQTSRIRNASEFKGNVSVRALQLRDDLYDQLGIPPEHQL